MIMEYLSSSSKSDTFFYTLGQSRPIMHPDSQLETAVKSGFDPKSLYSTELTEVNEPARTIIEKYSKIPADNILQHVKDLVCGSTPNLNENIR
jgi:hypothetical protein